MRRAFNSSERVALFLGSKGTCSICGDTLQRGWHADHIIPFSKGGATDISNAQALCPRCNFKKGASLRRSKLREWQEEALLLWDKHDKDSFFCEACPGAGKTTFALVCADSFLSENNTQIIVLSHTKHLKRQWSYAATDLGINLDYLYDVTCGFPAADMNGICLTYQALAINPDFFRKVVSLKRTLVIFDEIHHLGDGFKWGEAAKVAFSEAERKLALSGTPIRSGNETIPFIRYVTSEDDVEIREAIPDYSYNYKKALKDRVCRQVFFPKFNGEMEWVSRNERTYKCTFDDNLPSLCESERLRTALNPSGEWLRETLETANRKLDYIRESGHEDAGGIVFAKDNVTAHAQEIRKMLIEITGNEDDVVIATSEESESSDVIKAFAKNKIKWLVSVRMVSEGVDIPRLRVGVHATNWVTELFFRQAVGRICRFQDCVDDEMSQTSFYYIPSDERLVAYSLKMEDDIKHIIEEDEGVEGPPPPGPDRKLESSYLPLGSTGFEDGITSHSGSVYSKEEILHARSILEMIGGPPGQDLMLVLALRYHDRVKTNTESKNVSNSPTTINATDRKKNLRGQINKVVGRLTYTTDLDHAEIHCKLNSIIKTKSQKHLTGEELEQKLELAKRWLSEKQI